MNIRIFCADWSTSSGKRAVYVADEASRVIQRVAPRDWTLEGLLQEASRFDDSPCVIGVDVPIGVPRSYLDKALSEKEWTDAHDFTSWLVRACSLPGFLEDGNPQNWSTKRPFFKVPAGKGGLTQVLERAGLHGVDLFRVVDKATRAKSAFVSGLPGQVSPAARSFWRELAQLLQERRAFKLWPFDGAMDLLLADKGPVIGEIYPRAAYGVALLEGSAEQRSRLAVSKTDGTTRTAAVATLRHASWVRAQRLVLKDLRAAEENEDDFDALMAAVALLRCRLEGIRIGDPFSSDGYAEGGILGLAGLNLSLPERPFRPSVVSETTRQSRTNIRRHPKAAKTSRRCPIPNCGWVFAQGRSGWDGHVGAHATHPKWLPEVRDPGARRRRFKEEYPGFFR